jgi:hypothetical protein
VRESLRMKTLFNKRGDPVAYISDDYSKTIYLTNGSPVAYLYNQNHVYGLNGRHLGWWIEGILYNHDGERIGFISTTCPVSIGREPAKTQRQSMDEMKPRWEAPPLPKLSFSFADLDLEDLLQEGRVVRSYGESPSLES